MDPLEMLILKMIPAEDVMSNDNRKTTPLHLAAMNGDLEEVKRLVATKQKGPERKEFIDKKDNYTICGMTALGRAVVAGHPEVVKYLVEENASLGHIDELLRLSVENNKKTGGKLVKIILDTLPDVNKAKCINTGDFGNNTAVHLAALHGVLDALDLLVKAGGKISTATVEMGDTPLIMAVDQGHETVVEYLLENFDAVKEGMSKTDYINVRNFEGKSVLDLVNGNLRPLVLRHYDKC